MKKTFMSLLVFCFTTVSILPMPIYAQDPQLPANEINQPSGSTSDQLLQAQSINQNAVSVAQAIENAAGQNAFVSRNGTDLSLNGSQYKFSLADQYYLFYKSQTMVNEVFQDASSLGISVLRTWGFCDGMYKEGVSFQPSAGVYDESGFLKMDYLIYKASLMKMKLIIPFVNNWNDFGGMDQYVKWYLGTAPTTAQRDLFFTDPTIKGWYKDYVTHFLDRVNTYTGIAYKNDPTILAWELANEPRANTDSSGTVLNPWINEMAQYVKSVDSNHLLSTGIEGWYGNMSGVDFVQSQSSPNIDIATFHLFPDYYGLSSSQALQWITQRAADAQNVLGKPVYIGEFGKMVDRTAADAATQMRNRDALYKSIYDTASGAGVDGAGFWLLSGHQDDGTLYPDYDKFSVYKSIDASTVRAIKAGSALFTVSQTTGKGGKKGAQTLAVNQTMDATTSLLLKRQRESLLRSFGSNDPSSLSSLNDMVLLQ